MKTRTLIIGLIILSLVAVVALTNADTGSSAPIYNDSTEYFPSSHTYDTPDTQIDRVTVSTRGTSNGEFVYATFMFSDGTDYKTASISVPYLSWNTRTFTNPKSDMTVTGVTITGERHTYLKDFNAYFDNSSGTGNGGTGGNSNNTNPLCGNGIKNIGEECDSGANNGKACTPDYGSSCTYCSATCKITVVKGGFCGDGIVNGEERCDDGNDINTDGCTNDCKKPFEVVTENFAPLVWQCDHRVVYDDSTEPGRVSDDGQTLVERINDYAFEGEQIKWKVLVMDKNGIDKVPEVYVTVDGNKEANCQRIVGYEESFKDNGGIEQSCNAQILEEKLKEFDPLTMAYYECTFTVETPDSDNMYGEKDITVEALDLSGLNGTMAESEHWFLNPSIQLSVDGDITFDSIRQGTSGYSQRILVGNAADDGSGVMLDMFVSGTDFYDLANSGAKCDEESNVLLLKNFKYYATHGAYSTHDDPRADKEGYVPIQYGIGFNNPNPFYNENEMIQAEKVGPYYTANLLSPGAEMALVFRLDMPEPCNGDFNSGKIYFWGEAV